MKKPIHVFTGKTLKGRGENRTQKIKN